MRNPTSSKKGQSGWIEILMTILMAAAIVTVAFQIPRMMQDFADLITLASAEATARSLAGLITVSGAAPDSITIIYESEGEDAFYDVKIEDRIVYITGLTTGGDAPERVKTLEGPLTEGWAKIAVGYLNKDFKSVRVFTIEKERLVAGDAAADDYDVSAT
jgi:hypothetical protein